MTNTKQGGLTRGATQVEINSVAVHTWRILVPGEFKVSVEMEGHEQGRALAALAPLIEARDYAEALQLSRRAMHRLRHGARTEMVLRTSEPDGAEVRRSNGELWLLHKSSWTVFPRSRSKWDILNMLEWAPMQPSAVVLSWPPARVDLFWVLEGRPTGTEDFRGWDARRLGPIDLRCAPALPVWPMHSFWAALPIARLQRGLFPGDDALSGLRRGPIGLFEKAS
jgi:hypothetical protein